VLPTIIYISIAFIAGFSLAWFLQWNKLAKQGRLLKSNSGYLESERLMKETIQKELAVVHQNKMAAELELNQKLQTAHKVIKQMDMDILLMQKSYEETDSLLQAKQPEVHALKVQLIEAQNNIARLKAKLAERKIS
jgi:peptidoglycan hydrolase CwlO-like protein